MSDKLKKQRERATNFSATEVQRLLQLCNKHSRVLENQKTDAVTNTEKEKIWKLIEIEFNSNSSGVFRSAKSLHQKYDGKKKEIRKKLSEEKKYQTDTGGGPYQDLIDLTPEEAELVNNIKLTIHGHPNYYGSDTDNNPENPKFNIDVPKEIIESQDIDDCISPDWGSFRAPMLQTKKHEALKRPAELTKTLVVKVKRFTLPSTSDTGISTVQEEMLEEQSVDDPNYVFSGDILDTTPTTPVVSTSARSSYSQSQAEIQSLPPVTPTHKNQLPTHKSEATPGIPVTPNQSSVSTVTPLAKIYHKKKTNNKNGNPKPFEALAEQKTAWVTAERELVDLKKKHAEELHEIQKAQLIERHEWKRQRHEIKLKVLEAQADLHGISNV